MVFYCKYKHCALTRKTISNFAPLIVFAVIDHANVYFLLIVNGNWSSWETGFHVQRRVLEEQGHDIDCVTIQHQIMAVLLAQDWTLKRYHALQLSYAQVFR